MMNLTNFECLTQVGCVSRITSVLDEEESGKRDRIYLLSTANSGASNKHDLDGSETVWSSAQSVLLIIKRSWSC